MTSNNNTSAAAKLWLISEYLTFKVINDAAVDVREGTENIWSTFLLLNPGITIHPRTPSITRLLFWIFYVCGRTVIQSSSSSAIRDAYMQFEIAKVYDLETQMQQIRGCDSANRTQVSLNSSPFAGLEFSRLQQCNPKDLSSKKWQQSEKK